MFPVYPIVSRRCINTFQVQINIQEDPPRRTLEKLARQQDMRQDMVEACATCVLDREDAWGPWRASNRRYERGAEDEGAPG